MRLSSVEPSTLSRFFLLLSVSFFLQTATYAQESNEAHLVKKGETLYAISRTYGLTVRELQAMNQMSGTVIQPGQLLTVGTLSLEEQAFANKRVASETATPTTSRSSLPLEPDPSSQPTYDPYSNPVSYRELSYLERRRSAAFATPDVSPAPSESFSGPRFSDQAGFSDPTPLPSSTTVAKKTYHEVKKGETIYQLAYQFGVSVEELREWNMIREVRPGQTIVVQQQPMEVNMAQVAQRNSASQVRNTRNENLSLRGSAARQPASLGLLQVPGGKQAGAGESNLSTRFPASPNTSVPRGDQTATSNRRVAPGKADPELPLLSQLLQSKDKYLYLGRVAETGTYGKFEDAFITDRTFYAAHKSLPSGTIVYMDVPNNAGFIEVEIVATLSPRSAAMVGLSPACIELLRSAGSNSEVTLIYD
jgi:LysM repeat protein